MSATAELAHGKIIVRCKYEQKDCVMRVPGYRWVPQSCAWAFPATPATAMGLSLSVPGIVLDSGVQGLLETERKTIQNQGLKTAQDLPDVVGSKTKAWKHQRQAFWFAEHMPAVYLNMDMGTGKTKVTVDLLAHRGHRRVLIVCPKAVIRDVWPREFKTHCGVDFKVLPLFKGTVAQKVKDVQKFTAVWERFPIAVIVNYEAVWRPEMEKLLLGKFNLDCMVLDEAHKCKGVSGRAANFLARLGKRVPNRIALSGTMLPHSPMDAFAQFEILDPGIFGTSFAKFRQRYAIMGGFENRAVVGTQNDAEFNQKLMRITYRVGKEVLDLPEFQHIEMKYDLPPVARRIYDQLAEEFIAEIDDGTVTADNVLVKLLRFQQITGGFVALDQNDETAFDGDQVLRDGKPVGKRVICGNRLLCHIHDEKAGLLGDILDCLPVREPVVVFGRFQYDLQIIHNVCESQGRSCAELSGRVNQLQEWKDGHYDCIAVQIQAGGTGVSLVRARYCVYYSLGFSLGDYEQSLSRVHRPGQRHPVVFYHLVARNSVDTRIYAALRQKKKIVDYLLDLGRDCLTDDQE